jgi:hypothetical protein
VIRRPLVILALVLLAACQNVATSPTDCPGWSDACSSIRSSTNCTTLRDHYDLDRQEIEHWTDEAIANQPPSERAELKDFLQYRETLNARRMARMKELGCDLPGSADEAPAAAMSLRHR